MSGHIHTVFGRPRSGKSTIANKLVEKTDNQARVIICGDDIRLALSGDRFNELTEGFVRAIKYTTIRALYYREHYIIVDGTYSTWGSWRPLLEIDPNLTYEYIDTDSDECIRRAILTQQDDLIPIIQRIDKQFKELMIDFDNRLNRLRNEYRR